MTALLDDVAVVTRPVGAVTVTGPDRLTYLHSLLSQHVEGARPGTVADFLYLDAKGNAQAEGRMVVRAGEVLLLVATDVAAPLADRLASLTFLLDAKVEETSAAWALASVRGPEPLPAPGARPEPMTAAPHQAGLVIRDRSGGIDLLGDPEWVRERMQRLQVPEADRSAYERWRILQGVPAWGSEITPGRRPQELGVLPTHVHLRKGCYPGQEVIAKMYNLGRPRRALARVASASPLHAGQALQAGAKRGEVTSAAVLDDRFVGLALVPLDAEGRLPTALSTDDGSVEALARVGAGLPQPGASSP